MSEGIFKTTAWSRIQEAQDGESAAVGSFVRLYQPALLRFVRSKGFKREDAEDMAQEVFIRLFSREALARADRERGRFRSFLAGIAMNVIREELQRRKAKKRGSGVAPLPLDEGLDVPMEQDDEATFARHWAEQLLTEGLEDLKTNNPRQYEALTLKLRDGLTPQQICERMERTNQQVRNDLHRARKRIAKFVRNELLRTASSKEEFDEDLALFASLVGLELDNA